MPSDLSVVGVEVNTGRSLQPQPPPRHWLAGLGRRRMESSPVRYGHDEGICPGEVSVGQIGKTQRIGSNELSGASSRSCEMLHLRTPHWFPDQSRRAEGPSAQGLGHLNLKSVPLIPEGNVPRRSRSGLRLRTNRWNR